MTNIELLESKPSRVSMKRHLMTHGVDRGEGRSRRDYGDGRHPINYSKLKRLLAQYEGKSWKECREKMYAGLNKEQRHYVNFFLEHRVMEEHKGDPFAHCRPDYLITGNGTLKKNDRDYSSLPVKEIVVTVVEGREVFCRYNGEWKRILLAKGESFGGNETKWSLRMGNYVPVNEWVWYKDFFGFNPARDINTDSYQGLFSGYKKFVHKEAIYTAPSHPDLYQYYAKRLVAVAATTKNWLENETRGKIILDLGDSEVFKWGFISVDL